MRMPRRLALFTLLFAVLSDAGAATRTWTGAIDSNWHEPGNWSPPGVPVGTDTILIAGAEVNATPPVTIASGGTLNWTGAGGLLNGTLIIAGGGVFSVGIDPASTLQFSASVTNAGTLRWFDGTLGVYGGSGIVNQPGGTIDAQSDQFITGDRFILNEGLFLKSAGNGMTAVSLPLSNTTGIVQADTGVISLGGGGVLAGAYHASAGAAIELGGGQFTYSTPPAFTGPGAIRLNGATLTLLDDLMPGLQLVSGALLLSPGFQGGTITNLSLFSGLTLSGNYTVSGTLNSSNATLQGNLTIASGATVNRSGGLLFGQPTIASGGTLNWTGAGGFLNGTLNIATGAVLNVGIDSATTLAFFGGVTNAGTLRWTNGNLGIYSTPGLVNQPGGIIDAQSDHSIYGNSFILNTGLFRKSAGTGTTAVTVPLTNTTGTVQADTGTLSFQSAFHQSPAATLAISISGPTAGTNYGRIQFTQPLALAGSFTASARNGYLPSPGDTFTALSYPSVTGEFACLSPIVLGNGIALLPSSFPNRLTLTAASYVPDGTPSIFIMRWQGGVRLFRPPGFSDWEFVTTTNLFAPVWTPVPASGCDQATLPITAPQQYFRLRKN